MTDWIVAGFREGVTRLLVGPCGFQIRIDPLLPIGIVRMIDMQTGKGVEYNERTGQLTQVTP